MQIELLFIFVELAPDGHVLRPMQLSFDHAAVWVRKSHHERR